MRFIIILITVVAVGIISFLILRPRNYEKTAVADNNTIWQTVREGYKNINPAELRAKLSADESLFLLDVHIPEQEHIDGTDAFIPYDELEDYLDELPQHKNTPIVVYCRSGSMSRIASKKLLDLGYTDVSNLEGGTRAWNKYQQH